MKGCWCCGEECMFCGGDDPECYGPLKDGSFIHWCAMCKYGGCPACCECTSCVKEKHGAYSPENAKVSHGGYPVTHDWRDIP